ncbi:MAG: hypothetical protein WBO76_08935 [Saprospiraceae bacterium]
MNKTFSIIGFILFSYTCYGQELTLSSCSDLKLFRSGSIYEVVLAESRKTKAKSSRTLIGTLNSVNSDSIKFDLIQLKTKTKTISENTNIIGVIQYNNNDLQMTISPNQIYYLKNYKSHHIRTQKNTLRIVGSLFMISSMATFLNSIIVSHDASRNKLFISGGIQSGIGLSLIILGTSKRYLFKDTKKPWTIYQ